MTEKSNEPISLIGGTDAGADPLYEKIGMIQGILKGVSGDITNINTNIKEMRQEISQLKDKLEALSDKIEAQKLTDSHEKAKEGEAKRDKAAVAAADIQASKTSRFRWIIGIGITLIGFVLTYLIATGKIKILN